MKTEEISQEYSTKRSIYESFSRSIAEVMRQLLESEGQEYLTIDARSKTEESLTNKINRPDKSNKYSKLADITDLAGVRVTAFLLDDTLAIEKIIKENFQIDEENSIKKEEELDPDKFGYLSHHYVISYRADRVALKEFERFDGLKAEIQVRTVLQHAWAAIDWKLRYKSKEEVPSALKRRLYRISALLEAADEDFQRVAADSDALQKRYGQEVQSGVLSAGLDRESMDAYLRESPTVSGIGDKLKGMGVSVVGMGLPTESRISALIRVCESAGLRTLSDIDSILTVQREQIVTRILKIYADWKEAAPTVRVNLSIEGVLRAAIILSANQRDRKKLLEISGFGGIFLSKLTAEALRK